MSFKSILCEKTNEIAGFNTKSSLCVDDFYLCLANILHSCCTWYTRDRYVTILHFISPLDNYCITIAESLWRLR